MKIGDKIYEYDNGGIIYESTIIDIGEIPVAGGYRVVYNTPFIAFDDRAIGETVFMSESEAKKAFGRSYNNDKTI